MTQLHSATQGHGPDLVLLHGWGMNAGVWGPLATALATDYRVHCLDLPGFGHSHEVLPETYTLSTITEQVAARVPRDSIVIGWSLGGLVAQQLALHWADNVRHLIGIATSPCFLASQDWPGIDAPVLDAFRYQLHSDASATIDRFLAIQAMGSGSTRRDIANVRQAIDRAPAPQAEALEGGLSILQHTDLRSGLDNIQCPTLRIYGRRDSLVPVSVLERVEQLQPETRSMLFPKASHAPFISHPQDFQDALLRYLRHID